MPYPFLLSYARQDANAIDGTPDPIFAAFFKRLNQRVTHFTGSGGYLDKTDIQPGEDWPQELAETLRTAQTMVCLYSPSYFQSENCGKEMQVFLDRRSKYMGANPGQKPPANIIPVIWQRVVRWIPKTLPDIEYRDANHDPYVKGVWDLGDEGQSDQLLRIADQIAMRVQTANDETPLPALEVRPRMNAVQSAFLPPRLPLPEFDNPGTPAGPNAVTFVYASTKNWDQWPWAPPPDHAFLYLAAAAAKGREMESTQLAFNLTDASFAGRLSTLRQRNNVVLLIIDGVSLIKNELGISICDYDHPAHTCFGIIVLIDQGSAAQLQAVVRDRFPFFSKRAYPHFQIYETKGPFNAIQREKFGGILSSTLDELKWIVIRETNAPVCVGHGSQYQNLPGVKGPGTPEVEP